MTAPAPLDTPPGAATGPVVDLRTVSVAYGRQWALKDVSAVFPPGAVGLLGPNGAGKSTLLKALLGFIVPAEGEMRVLGLDVAVSAIEIRSRIGYMPESDAHIPGMTAVAQLTAGSVSLDGNVLPMGVAQHVFVSALDEELTPAEAAPRL